MTDYRVGPSPDLVAFMNTDLRIKRGGIKYPKPKEDSVKRTTREDLLKEKKAAEALLESVEARIADIDAALEKAKIAEPGYGHDRFSLQVKFARNGTVYEFLLLRSNGRWFTTGSGSEVKVFMNWDAFLAWINKPEIVWHSDLQRLKLDTCAWSLSRGELIVNDQGEPPF